MKKALDLVCRTINMLLLLLMASFTTIILLQVLFRYVANYPLTWSEQVSRYMFIWGVLLAIPVIYRNKRDIAFDLLLQKFPPAIKRWMERITALMILGFSGYFFYQSFQFCLRSIGLITAGVRIPLVAIYAAQPVCAVLIFMMGIEQLVTLFKPIEKRGGE